jgi:hypothetical protein
VAHRLRALSLAMRALGREFLSGQNGIAIPVVGSTNEALTPGVVVIAHAPTPIRIKAAANMLILRIFILLLIPIKITAYAAALANITPIGIVRMSGVVDLVSLVSSSGARSLNFFAAHSVRNLRLPRRQFLRAEVR